jgi:hypothetical protein
MPPQTKGKPQIEVILPSGEKKYYDADLGEAEIRKRASADTKINPPSLVPPQPANPGGARPVDWGLLADKGIDLGIDVAGLMGGGTLGNLAGKAAPMLAKRLPQVLLDILEQGGLGAASSLADDQDPTLGAAISGGTTALGAAAPAIRRAGNWTALKLGGIRGPVTPVLDAVENLRGKLPNQKPVGGITIPQGNMPVGAEARAGREIKTQGQLLGNREQELDAAMAQTVQIARQQAAAQQANAAGQRGAAAQQRAAGRARPVGPSGPPPPPPPGQPGAAPGPGTAMTTTGPPQLALGPSEELSPFVLRQMPKPFDPTDVVDADSVTTIFPPGQLRQSGQAGLSFQGAGAAGGGGGRPPGWGGPGRGIPPTQQPVPPFPPGSIFPVGRVPQAQKSIGEDAALFRRAHDETFPISVTEGMGDNQLQHLVEQIQEAQRPGRNLMNASDLGNLKRNTARRGQDVFKMKQRGERLSPAEDVFDQQAANWSSGMRDTQEAMDPEGKLGDINKILTDLFTVQEANNVMRGGGGVISDLGQLGMRGGLTHGMGQSVFGRSLQDDGTPLGTLRRIMPILGMVGLAPSNVSRLGNAAALFPKVVNKTDWVAEVGSEMADGLQPPGVKRREPQ